MHEKSAGAVDDAAMMAGNGTGTLLQRVGRAQRWVQEHLMRTRSEERSSRRQGERQDVLSALGERLATLARLLQGRDLTADNRQRTDMLIDRLLSLEVQTSEPRARIGFSNKTKPEHRELDVVSAWQVASELECLLVELGDVDYLQARVDEEWRRAQDPNARSSFLLPDAQQLDSLRAELRGVAEASDGPAPAATVELVRRCAVEMLIPIYQARSRWEGEQFRLQLLRKARLQWVQWILVTQLVTAAVVLVAALRYATAGDSLPAVGLKVGLAVVMGMMGAVLAGVRRLREEPLRANELSNYKAALGAQLFVGGALALIAFNLLELNVLPVFDPDGSSDATEVAQLAVYGMLAGFSEPFVIGILQSLMQSRRPIESASATETEAPAPPAARVEA